MQTKPMNRLHSTLLLATVALLSTAATPAETAIDLEDVRIPHHKFVLDNGLTLLVHEDHSVPIVAVNVWYHVGSRNERRGRTGFAHLFEHFFFNGSENYPHGFREAMDDLGVNNRNGTTSNDRTNFFEDVPVSGLERTLYLEADRMGFLAGNLSQQMLERERGVVQNEKRQRENQPYGRVFNRIVESVYPYSHPYSWSVIGTLEDLDAATLDDVKQWYETYYGPNNCVLSLAGDITPERALELVERYFGAIPPGPPTPDYQEWVPRFARNVRDQMDDRVPQSRIYRVYQLPPWGDRDTIHFNLLASVLSGSKSGRLDRRLIFDKELATQVAAFVWEKELASNLLLMVTVKPGVDPREAEREMDSAVAEFLEGGPTETELATAQTRILADFVRGMERLGGFGGRSDILAESMIFGGRPDAYLGHLETLSAATPAAVLESGQRWLSEPHYTLTVDPFAELSAPGDTLDRSVLPALGDAPGVDFPEVQRSRLANGLEVLLLERHTAPLVNMALAVDAGYSADTAETAGLASLTLDLMDEGTATRDAFRIADELDALGAEISTGSSLDQSFVYLRALKANLAPSLTLLADVVLNPSFPEEMVEINKQRRLASIEQEKANPFGAVLRVAPKLLYGAGHAYANPLSGAGFETTVGGMTREDLVAWHRTWFQPNTSSLIVTGDTTLAELVPRLEAAFGGWPAGEAPKKNIESLETASKGRVFLIDKPGAEQSVIVAGHLSRPGGRPEDLAMEAVMRLFGGMSTSRLNRNLRLDKHWSYGTRGLLADARGQRPFVVLAPVQTDKTKESMLEVAAEIAGIAGERPVAGEEFASIMRNMTLRLPGRFETLRALEGAAIDLVNYGYPAGYYYDYADNMRGLTEEDLAAAAASYVTPGELFWLVVGDLEKIEAGVRELGYGE
ncbi:MAG: M16 family metallopeptidase, partial [Thermoanaerobaculia bacterium]